MSNDHGRVRVLDVVVPGDSSWLEVEMDVGEMMDTAHDLLLDDAPTCFECGQLWTAGGGIYFEPEMKKWMCNSCFEMKSHEGENREEMEDE